MKYLKIYESAEVITFETWIDQRYGRGFDELDSLTEVSCTDKYLTDLNGIENLINLVILRCGENKLTSLKGIENLLSINRISCFDNKLTGLKELENLVELENLDCGINKIKSLDGIQNCKKLRILTCDSNELKNLDEIIGLDCLRDVISYENPFEEPIKPGTFKYLRGPIYDPVLLQKFRSYEFQKEFLDEHPEKIKNLEHVGFDKKIIEEYKELIGFFNIKL